MGCGWISFVVGAILTVFTRLSLWKCWNAHWNLNTIHIQVHIIYTVKNSPENIWNYMKLSWKLAVANLRHRWWGQEHHHPRLMQWISAPFRSLFQHLSLVAHVIVFVVLITLTALAIFKLKESRQHIYIYKFLLMCMRVESFDFVSFDVQSFQNSVHSQIYP